MADKYMNQTGLSYFWGRIKALFATKAEFTEGLALKVDKVSGKELSTNDYTTTEKNKLGGIATGAQVNVIEIVAVNNTNLTPASKRVNITVPTKVSGLTNDSNYQTQMQVEAIVASSIGELTGFEFVIVDALPPSGAIGKVYLVPIAGSADNGYEEWAWINGAWERLGTTEIDLTGYWSKDELVAITTAEIDVITV